MDNFINSTKSIRLTRFFTKLDSAMSEHVWSLEVAIEDGQEVEELPTKENFFDIVYNEVVNENDLKFLGKKFIEDEINKYFDDKNYWFKIRKQYKIY